MWNILVRFSAETEFRAVYNDFSRLSEDNIGKMPPTFRTHLAATQSETYNAIETHLTECFAVYSGKNGNRVANKSL